ncbi:MAG TPA: PfkB family carbohydrate kinase [Candidatus Limnocylindria bacterium]|nr:PfkB family carbohydrate kinase [Candidatus Limnocylindria bacterium]
MPGPPPPLDLIVVGGLTVDRFADGTSTPGGSVLHATRALAGRAALGAITVAGPEPEADDGRRILERATTRATCQPADASITYRHSETAAGRRLWLERAGGRISLDADAAQRWTAAAILLAPVARELDSSALAGWPTGPLRAAILQGWLRSADEGGEVRPRRLDELERDLAEGIAALDVLVASREDLRAEAGDPWRQLAALRSAVGPRPLLIVTDGAGGAWIDDHGGTRHLAVPYRVDGVPTVGAGDVFAAALAAGGRVGDLRSAHSVDRRVAGAMRTVADMLAARRR